MKICTIVGARPQFVKAAVICRALAFCNENNAYGIEHTIIHTALADLKLEPSSYILATIHRAENTDEPSRLAEIFSGLSHSSRPIVLPIHPRLRHRLERFELTVPENVMTIPPVGYVDMVMLELSASLIVTDSGGVQKEAYFHKVPCLTRRDETEWVETMQSGWNRLVPADSVKIAEALKADFCPPCEIKKHYGDGNSGQAIVRYIIGR